MRSPVFLVYVGTALFAAVSMAFPFAMNECQLSGSQVAVQKCFFDNALGAKAYFASLPAFLITSILLYKLRSRWAQASCWGIAVGPFLASVIWVSVHH
jgi:hypothetical protein